jgi:cysteine desulfurase / selenocysteine lyase
MKNVRNDFPIFKAHKDLIYFDNASTSQKPKAVIDTISHFYSQENAPIKRGMYALAEHATELYEGAREIIANFINAHPEEIIFTSGATEGINFIAAAWGQNHIVAGDEIVITQLEHHANILPWQRLSEKSGVVVRFIPVDNFGKLDLENLDRIITEKTKLVSFLTVSNALGSHVDCVPIISRARQVGAKVLLDVCQSITHQKLDVKKMDCDFLVFSGHKILGPTGVGVLFIRKELQPEIPPYQVGGGIVFEATYEKTRFLEPPQCYEPGTPPIAQVIGLGRAIQYLNENVDIHELQTHEAALCARAIEGLKEINAIRILGPIEELKKKGHLVSFVHEKYHFHDIGAYLDQNGICVRTGHYCAQPLARKLGIDGSIRISFYLYNTPEEVDRFLEVMRKLG